MLVDDNKIVHLYVVERKSYRQIAKACGCSPSYVRSTLIKKEIEVRPACKFESLIGKMFGNLEVVELVRKAPGGTRMTIWRCLCHKCKSLTEHNGRALRTTNACKQCQFERRCYGDKVKRYEEMSASVYYRLQYDAKNRGLPFEVTREYIWSLFEKQNRRCALTGVELKFGRFNKDLRQGRTASLDRIDSSVGYLPGNVRWVHKIVNMMKQRLSDEQLLHWAARLVEHENSRHNNLPGRT